MLPNSKDSGNRETSRSICISMYVSLPSSLVQFEGAVRPEPRDDEKFVVTSTV